MRLYHVEFTHYGPKDSEDGTTEWVLAKDDEALHRWIEKAGHLNFTEMDEEEEEGDVWPDSEWLAANPLALDVARAAGLIVDADEYSTTIAGPLAQVIKWWRGDVREPEDTYYGVTRYHWDAGQDVTDEEAAVLAKFIAVWADATP